jgi:hypothetical protein
MLQTGSTKLFQLDETLSAHQILRLRSTWLMAGMWKRECITYEECRLSTWLMAGCHACEERTGWWLGCERENASHTKSAVWVLGWWLVVVHAKKGLVDGWNVKERMHHIGKVPFEYLVGGWLSCMQRKNWHQSSTMGPMMGRENASSIAWFTDSLGRWVEEHGYSSL